MKLIIFVPAPHKQIQDIVLHTLYIICFVNYVQRNDDIC
jgi:hypothetical protein